MSSTQIIIMNVLFIFGLICVSSQAQPVKPSASKSVKKSQLTRPVAREAYISILQGQAGTLKSYKIYSDLNDPNKNLLMFSEASKAPQKFKLTGDQVRRIETLTFKVWDQLPKKKSRKKCAPFIQMQYLMGQKTVCVEHKSAVKDGGILLHLLNNLSSKSATKG